MKMLRCGLLHIAQLRSCELQGAMDECTLLLRKHRNMFGHRSHSDFQQIADLLHRQRRICMRIASYKNQSNTLKSKWRNEDLIILSFANVEVDYACARAELLESFHRGNRSGDRGDDVEVHRVPWGCKGDIRHGNPQRDETAGFDEVEPVRFQ